MLMIKITCVFLFRVKIRNVCNEIVSLWIAVKLPDASYAKVSKLINRRLKRYDKNVRPNDTGRNMGVRDVLCPWI